MARRGEPSESVGPQEPTQRATAGGQDTLDGVNVWAIVQIAGDLLDPVDGRGVHAVNAPVRFLSLKSNQPQGFPHRSPVHRRPCSIASAHTNPPIDRIDALMHDYACNACTRAYTSACTYANSDFEDGAGTARVGPD